MREHAADLGDFLTIDARGKALPGYLEQLATALTAERESIEVELRRLSEGVAHIAEIVSAQQSLAGVDAVIEPVRIADVVEDALRMAGVADQPGLTVIRDLADVGLVSLDRHRFLLILVNLITNAVYAMGDNADRPRQLRSAGRVDGRANGVDHGGRQRRRDRSREPDPDLRARLHHPCGRPRLRLAQLGAGRHRRWAGR